MVGQFGGTALGKNDPRFDIDLPFGEGGENLVAEILYAYTHQVDGHLYVEVKRKRRVDDKFYIELECDKGRQGAYKPSGLSITTADYWAFVVAETGVVVFAPVERVRRLIKDGWGYAAEERDGEYPTKGRLVSFNQLRAIFR